MINLKNLKDYTEQYTTLRDLIEYETHGAFFLDVESLSKACDKTTVEFSMEPGGLSRVMNKNKFVNKIKYQREEPLNDYSPKAIPSRPEKYYRLIWVRFFLSEEQEDPEVRSIYILEEELSNVRVLT